MADESFIPPGQEELIGAMLGNGVALPGGCKLVTGNIEKTTVKATYACSSGDVVVELAHPAAAPTNATRTEKFALWVESGTAPADLQSTLLKQIREREGQFRWTVYPAKTSPPQPMPTPMLSGGVVLGLLVIAAVLLWRRRTAAARK